MHIQFPHNWFYSKPCIREASMADKVYFTVSKESSYKLGQFYCQTPIRHVSAIRNTDFSTGCQPFSGISCNSNMFQIIPCRTTCHRYIIVTIVAQYIHGCNIPASHLQTFFRCFLKQCPHRFFKLITILADHI